MGASAIVTEMSLLIVAGAFAGYWLDDNLGTSPFLLLLGIVGGLIVGMTRLLTTLNRLTGDNEPLPPDDHP